MTYQLSNNINKDKIFIVDWSSARERLDAQYYREHFDFTGYHRLSEYVFINGGKRIPKGLNYSTDHDSPFLYLRVADLTDDCQIDYDNMKRIDESLYKILHRYDIHNGDIALSIAGSIGKVLLLHNIPEKFNVILTENCARISVKSAEQLYPEYLSILLTLPIVQKQIMFNYIQTTIPKLSLERLGRIMIPSIPDKDKQQSIIDTYYSALLHKQCNYKKAQRLLDSIDEHLLFELGVTIPEMASKLSDRIFFVNKKDISRRLNPGLYKNAISLESNKYDNMPLSHLAYINPTTTFNKLNEDTQISFIPMDAIDGEYFEIVGRQITTVNKAGGYTRFKEGDLLWAKITPCMENGKSAIAKELVNGYGCGSTEYHIVRPKNGKLLVEFIHLLLHMDIVRKSAVFYFGGSAGQQRVATDFLEKFNVPLPPRCKQLEIVNHILDIKAQAKALKEEGEQILDEAKQEIERQIMG